MDSGLVDSGCHELSENIWYLIIVADAGDAVSVNFSARCKFSRLNAKIYCVRSMNNVCNLCKCVVFINNYPVILYTVYFNTPRVCTHCVV